MEVSVALLCTGRDASSTEHGWHFATDMKSDLFKNKKEKNACPLIQTWLLEEAAGGTPDMSATPPHSEK